MVSFRSVGLALLASQPLGANAYMDDTGGDGKRSCDDLIVTIHNQTDIDFYETCTTLSDYIVSPDHSWEGPFVLPKVQSVPQLAVGYLLPKIKGDDRVDDLVTSVSMPDLKNITGKGLLFGYLDQFENFSMPKLEFSQGGIAISGNYKLRNVSFPALTDAPGGIYLDGHFDSIDLPALRSTGFMKIQSLGTNISCPGLAAQFASVNFTNNMTDSLSGFICWTPQENNTWDSHDPTGKGGLGKDKKSSASMLVYGYHSLAMVALSLVLL
ncbi:hypothetical protein NLG97_g2384 [Lecanicillium saksenae]|uniref:Uncharacterized protein n=1 Tax=Lecanicillium saksenae TaxID=468837 RepID=A0ACC1R2U4_9HYPO|nr:hypothetical protein NLG97_g2384 [Lecanicillium saksenae]